MTTFTVFVSQSTDDAGLTTGNSSNDLTQTSYIFTDGSSPAVYYVGLRFQNVTIPQGATISNAFLSPAATAEPLRISSVLASVLALSRAPLVIERGRGHCKGRCQTFRESGPWATPKEHC
jgi:hypothetical protein